MTVFGPIFGLFWVPSWGPKFKKNVIQKISQKKLKFPTSKDGLKMVGLGGLSTPDRHPFAHIR